MYQLRDVIVDGPLTMMMIHHFFIKIAEFDKNVDMRSHIANCFESGYHNWPLIG